MKRLRTAVPAPIRRNYALKFGIALLVLGVSVGIIGYGGTVLIQDDIEQRVTEDSGTVAAQEAEKLETWNEKNQLTATMLSRSGPVTSGNEAVIDDYLSQRVLELPIGSQAIHYVDVEEGRIVASSADDATGRSLAGVDEPWTETASSPSADVAVSTAYEDQFTGESLPMIAYTTQVNGDSGHAIVYTVNLHSYAANLQQSEEGSVVLVADGEDRIIADGSNANLLEQYDTAAPLDRARSGGPTNPGAMTVAPDDLLGSTAYPVSTDEDHVVGYAQVRNSDWVVLSHTPESTAYGFVSQVRTYGLYATFAGVLLIGAVGAVLGRNTAVSIDRLTDKTDRMKDGDLEVEFDTTRIDNIGRLYDGFASMRDSLKTQIQEAKAAREEAEQARTETERINRHLEEKADEYRVIMRACADGDLTARMDAESENEAMREIATEFNEMVDELETTVARVSAFANEVAVATEQVTASSEEVQSASKQVSESVQEIADGADTQHERFQRASTEIEGLSTTTEEIAASSNEVADIAERTAETGVDGKASAQEAVAGLNRIERDSSEAVAEIEALESEMAQVDELVEFISEVAEETNLLALNANIEASRDGTDSEGFSVVANEVKELSAKTKETADDIEDRLERIQTQTEQAVDVVTTTRERVAENRDVIEGTVESLEEIADYAQETNTGVQEISAATEEQAASTETVVTIVDEAATISAETTAETETVAAAAEEQTTALSEVTTSASDLATQASRLSETLDRFELDESIQRQFEPSRSSAETSDDAADPPAPVGTGEAPSGDPDSDRPVGFEPDGDEGTEADDEPDGDEGTEADDEPDGDEGTEADDEPNENDVFRFGADSTQTEGHDGD
ncbi:methyl-accepting chemotaxis protein [Natrinema salaciae]|uniref:Methyl-accepting chemotaxis protein n=1 Tax=Natrinema salaciae TaxID=1186196 RepID=A0A1H9LXC7_9EURY|nr:methyl-accepting chemotaxis protein [Natrinema salaciae]SER16080.1 methyl-accepting chemotaxis protein [Natrinema salaciae]